MILFFRTPSKSVIAVECDHELTQADSDKLCWLFGEATPESENNLKGHFVGPRREMITGPRATFYEGAGFGPLIHRLTSRCRWEG